MVEIDSDTYQVKTMRMESKAVPHRFLITPGRSQNLELLQHLLANTHQAIVLCGPEGVGKTCLLEVLQKRLKDQWRWCAVKGHGSLTFEEVHDRVGPLLRHHRSEAAIKNAGYGHSSDSHKDVILSIDDAGKMAPGLITQFIQLAENHPELRLLFVLTHDQWHIKNYSDPAIENCYLVEAKPLLQKECRDFVQHLASLTNALRFRNGLTDDIIDAVYRGSHGLPSRIITHFPELNKPKESIDPLAVLIIAVVCLVSLALYMQWFTASRPVNENTVAIVQPGGRIAHFDFEQPVISLPVGNLLKYARNSELQDTWKEGLAGINKKTDQAVGGLQPEVTNAPPVSLSPVDQATTSDPLKAPSDTASEAMVSTAPFLKQSGQVSAVDDAESWLIAQPENSYSLQLMVQSEESPVRAVVARHPELQPDLRMVRCILKEKEKFVLLYGHFADVESAKKAKESLPAEFKSSVIRKFGAIRKDFPPMPKP
jgi:DamX protein